MSSAYVGIKACGCAVAAIVDSPTHRKDTAKEIASWIRSGLTIERHTAEWVRSNLKRCKCSEQAKQLVLESPDG